MIVLIGDSMAVLSRSVYVLAFIEALIIALSTILSYVPATSTLLQIIGAICVFTFVIMLVLNLKGFYSQKAFIAFFYI